MIEEFGLLDEVLPEATRADVGVVVGVRLKVCEYVLKLLKVDLVDLLHLLLVFGVVADGLQRD